MYFPCDESAVFDLNVVPGKEWRNAVVGGVLLGYKARHWWLKHYSRDVRVFRSGNSHMINGRQDARIVKAYSSCSS